MRKNMKHNKLMTTMVLTMSVALISCSDDESKVQQATETASNVVTQVQAHSGIMNYIPADTPVLFVYSKDPKNPLPDNLKNKMEKMYSGIGNIIKNAVQEKYDNSQEETPKIAEMKEFMDKWMSEDGLKNLGLSIEENEFALYTIDLFPVLRITLAETHKIGDILDELLVKANESKVGSAVKKDVNGNTVYQYGNKEMQVMVSLAGNTIVASIAPTRDVDKLMPQLLGFEKPSKSIVQSNQYHDTIEKYKDRKSVV